MVRKIAEPDSSQVAVDFDTVDNMMKFSVVYHGGEDTLFLRPEKASPGTSIDWNGEIWIRVNVRTGAIVGLEIDEFESVFLKRHPELEKAWREFRALSKGQRQVRVHDAAVLIMLSFFKGLLRSSQPHLAGVSS